MQGLKTQKRSKADGIVAAWSPGTPGEGGSCRSTQLRPTLCPQPCDVWAATGKHFSAQLVAPCWALPREPEAGETRVLPLPGFIPAAGRPPAVAAWTVAPTAEGLTTQPCRAGIPFALLSVLTPNVLGTPQCQRPSRCLLHVFVLYLFSVLLIQVSPLSESRAL